MSACFFFSVHALGVILIVNCMSLPSELYVKVGRGGDLLIQDSAMIGGKLPLLEGVFLDVIVINIICYLISPVWLVSKIFHFITIVQSIRRSTIIGCASVVLFRYIFWQLLMKCLYCFYWKWMKCFFGSPFT